MIVIVDSGVAELVVIGVAAMATFASTKALFSVHAALPGAPDPARVTAGTYRADPLHTLVGWRVNHLGFNDYFGMFGQVQGTLVLDPANLSAARVSVRVPVKKVITASEGITGALLRNPAGGGKPDYFGAQPADALFVSTKVTPGADGRSAVIDGNLTLNGKTGPLSITATFAGAGKNPLTGKKVRRRERVSTEDLGVRRMAAYIDEVIAFAATELGVVVSEPLPPELRPGRAKKERIDADTGEILERT